MVGELLKINDKNFFTTSRCKLYELFKTGEGCNFTLKTSDGQYLTAHKIVLITCSDYFRNLLKSNTKHHEGSKNAIKLPNYITMQTLNLILRYLYIGEMELNGSQALSMYRAADFFLLEDLRMFCLSVVEDSLSGDNCVKLVPFGAASEPAYSNHITVKKKPVVKTNITGFHHGNSIQISLLKEKKIVLVNNCGIEQFNLDEHKWERYYKFQHEYKYGCYSACEYDNNIYISGGWDLENKTTIGLCNYFNSEVNDVFGITSMLETRSVHQMVGLGGRIYACGGMSNNGSAEYYDVQNNKWFKIKSMNSSNKCFGIATCCNAIFCVGGRMNNNRTISNAMEMYDPREGHWSNITVVSEIFHLNKTTNIGNKLFCVNPYSEGKFFNVVAGKWEKDFIRRFALNPLYWSHYDIITLNNKDIYGVWNLSNYSNSPNLKLLKLDQKLNSWVKITCNNCNWVSFRKDSSIHLCTLDLY